MFCLDCGKIKVAGSVTCDKCGAPFLALHATCPLKIFAAAQSNPATVRYAAQTKAEQRNPVPLVAGAALAGIGPFGTPTCITITVQPCKVNASCKVSVTVGFETGTLYVNP
jgi:hypothetical protein